MDNSDTEKNFPDSPKPRARYFHIIRLSVVESGLKTESPTLQYVFFTTVYCLHFIFLIVSLSYNQMKVISFVIQCKIHWLAFNFLNSGLENVLFPVLDSFYLEYMLSILNQSMMYLEYYWRKTCYAFGLSNDSWNWEYVKFLIHHHRQNS